MTRKDLLHQAVVSLHCGLPPPITSISIGTCGIILAGVTYQLRRD